MFEPPSETNWCYTHTFHEIYAQEYAAGYKGAQEGLSLEDNPNKESGHERDTTLEDELHYWWYKGFTDYDWNTK